MSQKVAADKIEGIVGAMRQPSTHIARAVSAEQTVYILHSALCLTEYADLRKCPFSLALDDKGIDVAEWVEDKPMAVTLDDGRLTPCWEQP